ncbi:hypothetical protein EVAR_61285_1 [Eumeta japonica]|uniref:Uncharacterized protein n=1 Tax=Eumeta variegata TaxID=151549 RepID=A0A4C1XMU8_EUMVA|nr:hypothetical protein EVAR_61285_1 [Eumeta japonica]
MGWTPFELLLKNCASQRKDISAMRIRHFAGALFHNVNATSGAWSSDHSLGASNVYLNLVMYLPRFSVSNTTYRKISEGHMKNVLTLRDSFSCILNPINLLEYDVACELHHTKQ